MVKLLDSTGSPRGYGGVVRLGPKGDGTPSKVHHVELLKVVELTDSTGSPRGYVGVVRLGPKGGGTHRQYWFHTWIWKGSKTGT